MKVYRFPEKWRRRFQDSVANGNKNRKRKKNKSRKKENHEDLYSDSLFTVRSSETKIAPEKKHLPLTGYPRSGRVEREGRAMRSSMWVKACRFSLNLGREREGALIKMQIRALSGRTSITFKLVLLQKNYSFNAFNNMFGISLFELTSNNVVVKVIIKKNKI